MAVSYSELMKAQAGVIVLLFAIGLQALPQERFDPPEALERARLLLSDIAQTRNSPACLQTINRTYFRRVNARDTRQTCDVILGQKAKGLSKFELFAADRIRLQAGVTAAGEEVYSWPEEGSAPIADALQLVSGGPFSTGALGPMVADVFHNPATEITFKGDRPHNGRNLYEYRYRVPVSASHYTLNRGAFIAYDGTFLLAPVSGDPVQLTARSSELPVMSNACEATVTIDFAPAEEGTGFRPPSDHSMHFVLRDGSESENRSSYSQCGTVEEKREAVAKPPLVAAPAGFVVTAALETAIDTAAAAVGDLVTLRYVAEPDTKKTVHLKLPKETKLHARIRGIERQFGKPNYFLLALELEWLEVEGGRSYLPARLISAAPPEVVARGMAAIARGNGSTDYKWLTAWQVHTRFDDFGKLSFESKNRDYVVPAGHVIRFVTK